MMGRGSQWSTFLWIHWHFFIWPDALLSRVLSVSGSGSPLSSLNRSSSTNKSTVAARRHLKRAATQVSGHRQANVSQLSSVQGRLLTQAELLKLGHFRRFLAGSGLGQLDFLYRVEQSRRQREDEASGEVDENGDTADNKGWVDTESVGPMNGPAMRKI